MCTGCDTEVVYSSGVESPLFPAQIRKQPTNDGGAEDDVADDGDDDNDPLVESFISNRGHSA